MTEPPSNDEQITTEEQFATALEQLLVAAENDIDPRGTWVVRNGDRLPDWDLTSWGNDAALETTRVMGVGLL